MFVFPLRLLSTLTRLLELLFEFRSPTRSLALLPSPGRVTFEVLSPEDRSIDLLPSVLEALSLATDALRSVGEVLEGVEGLEIFLDADLLYPPFTEDFEVVGLVVAGLELGFEVGLAWGVAALLEGRLLGLDIELRELLWPIR